MLSDDGASEGGEFEEVLVYPVVVENKKIIYNSKKST